MLKFFNVLQNKKSQLVFLIIPKWRVGLAFFANCVNLFLDIVLFIPDRITHQKPKRVNIKLPSDW